MSEFDPFDPRLGDIERRLAALSPRDARLNVADTLFHAGRESALQQQTRWRLVWPLVTAASVLLSVTLTTAIVRRPEERIVYVERPVAPPEQNANVEPQGPREPNRPRATRDRRDGDANEKPVSPGGVGYLLARRLALEYGVDSLPSTTTVASNGNPPPLRYGDWRRGLENNDLPFTESRQGMTEDSTETLPGFSGGSS